MTNYENTPVHEPGTVRYFWFANSTPRRWGSVEEQVKEAQRSNLEKVSSQGHEMKTAYYHECDCPNPEAMEKFSEVDFDELEDEWLERNCKFDRKTWFGRYPESQIYYDLYWKNRDRAINNIPLAYEYYKLQDAYDEEHPDGLCYNSEAGEFCTGCQDDPDFESVEVGPCSRHIDLREEYDEFWSLFSEDNERLR